MMLKSLPILGEPRERSYGWAGITLPQTEVLATKSGLKQKSIPHALLITSVVFMKVAASIPLLLDGCIGKRHPPRLAAQWQIRQMV
jgi:hypothetical protein